MLTPGLHGGSGAGHDSGHRPCPASSVFPAVPQRAAATTACLAPLPVTGPCESGRVPQANRAAPGRTLHAGARHHFGMCMDGCRRCGGGRPRLLLNTRGMSQASSAHGCHVSRMRPLLQSYTVQPVLCVCTSPTRPLFSLSSISCGNPATCKQPGKARTRLQQTRQVRCTTLLSENPEGRTFVNAPSPTRAAQGHATSVAGR